MHRQQRLGTTSSSVSSYLLPFPTCRSSPTLTVASASNLTSSLTSRRSLKPTSVGTLSVAAIRSTPSPSSPLLSSAESSLYRWRVQETSCSRLSMLAGKSPSSVSIPFCPRLVSVLAWSMSLLLLSSCIGITHAGIVNGHPLGKRSFIDIQCKGIYDKSIFARLDRICEDCYNLFREPQLHQLCRKNCFTSDYFKGCLDVLLLQDEVEKIQTWIKQLHGAEPGV